MKLQLKSKAEIAEFARAIALQYVESSGGSDGLDDEFISAIELDLRSTLRDEIAKIATIREVEETNTIDFADSNASDPGNLDLTLDSEFGIVEATLGADSDVDHATLAPQSGQNASPGSATVRSGGSKAANADQTDSSKKSTVRSGRVKQKTVNGAARDSAPEGYEIIDTLGKGGMGVVYKARHIPLDRLVAIKMIISGAHASDDQVQRFQKEAEAAAHLKHPNIVSVYEVGEHDGLPYFSLEFVDGPSMAELMSETTMSAKEAAQILLPVARAIEYSHEMGVLHRDLKPQNILITPDGAPKVADFGLAKRLDSTESQTMTGVVVGTPGYLAPEQASDTKKVGKHTDVYALGCILYYLMTGRPPFKGPTPVETIRQLLFSEPLPPSQLQEALDKDLETICLKALEKEIPKRYATAGELADELQRFIEDKPILARPITRWERIWKWCKRNPRVASLAGVVAGLLAFLFVGSCLAAIVFNSQKQEAVKARSLAETNAELASEQAEIARNASRVVIYTTKDFFDEHPELAPLRKSMLDAIAKDVERIQDDQYGDGASKTMKAATTHQVGRIYLGTGEYERAIELLLDAEKQLVALNEEGNLPRAAISQMDLCIAIGDCYLESGDLENAEERYLKALELRKDYFRAHVDKVSDIMRRQSMSEIYGRLFRLYSSLGNTEKMLLYAQLSVDARRDWLASRPGSLLRMEELSGALGNLSVVYERMGEKKKMIETSSEVLGLSATISKNKSDFRTRHNVATQRKALARQSLSIGQVDQSKDLLNQAAATFDEITERSPDNSTMTAQAADTNYWLGVTLTRKGEDAAAAFEKAATFQRRLLEKSNSVNNQGMLLKVLSRAGHVDEAREIADQFSKKTDSLLHCGYAACGYSMMAQHVPADQRDELMDKGIASARKLIELGYSDFKSMRETDHDFEFLRESDKFLKMLNEEQAKQAK